MISQITGYAVMKIKERCIHDIYVDLDCIECENWVQSLENNNLLEKQEELAKKLGLV